MLSLRSAASQGLPSLSGRVQGLVDTGAGAPCARISRPAAQAAAQPQHCAPPVTSARIIRRHSRGVHRLAAYPQQQQQQQANNDRSSSDAPEYNVGVAPMPGDAGQAEGWQPRAEGGGVPEEEADVYYDDSDWGEPEPITDWGEAPRRPWDQYDGWGEQQQGAYSNGYGSMPQQTATAFGPSPYGYPSSGVWPRT